MTLHVRRVLGWGCDVCLSSSGDVACVCGFVGSARFLEGGGRPRASAGYGHQSEVNGPPMRSCVCGGVVCYLSNKD